METILLIIFLITFAAAIFIWIGWNKEVVELEQGEEFSVKKVSPKKTKVVKEKKQKPMKPEKTKKKSFEMPKVSFGKKSKSAVEEEIDLDFDLGGEDDDWSKAELKQRNRNKEKDDFMDFEDFDFEEAPKTKSQKQKIEKEVPSFDDLFEEDLEEVVQTKPERKGNDFDDLFDEEELKEIEAIEKGIKKTPSAKTEELPRFRSKPVEEKIKDDLDDLDFDFELEKVVEPKQEKEESTFKFDFDEEALGEEKEEETDIEELFKDFDFASKDRDHIDEDFFEKKKPNVQQVREEKKSNYKDDIGLELNLELFGLGEEKDDKVEEEAFNFDDIFTDEKETLKEEEIEEMEKTRVQKETLKEKKEDDGLELDFDFDFDDDTEEGELEEKITPVKKQVEIPKVNYDDADDDEILKMIDNLYEITKDDK